MLVKMAAPIQILKGLKVTKVEIVHDYVQLAFGDEIGISVYNEMDISPKIPLERLVSKTVISVKESVNSIDIDFADGIKLTIDMRPQAYQGPEAIELNRVGFPPVIWKFAYPS
ncbi:MAG: hypothetical protein QOI87_2887 [Bradyrhizobium sp.]|jgi:hypothetical protein|nr:hypothetical protein [Bradyrhizobium sp.]